MQKQTIGPLQTIGASLSTRKPMDMHRTPWFSTGIIFMSVKEHEVIKSLCIYVEPKAKDIAKESYLGMLESRIY